MEEKKSQFFFWTHCIIHMNVVQQMHKKNNITSIIDTTTEEQ